MPDKKSVAKADLTKSAGHIGWVGDFEYFKNAQGDLYRAHTSDVIDISTSARMGRFISTAAVADKLLAHLGLLKSEDVRQASVGYENRKSDRIDRMEDRAEGAAEAGRAALYSGMQMLKDIPFGQPILVGHHSERGDRARRERAASRVDKGSELLKQAAFLRSRAAAAAGNNAISSDDPLALQKLNEKLSEMRDHLSWMKLVNKYFKAGKLTEIGFSAEQIATLEKNVAQNYSWERQPYPKYNTANLSANIRRVEKRIQELQLRVVQEPVTEQIGKIRIEENQELNRVQLRFPGKPPEEVRSRLSHAGFHWSREEVAWQAQRSPGNLYKAEEIATEVALGRLGQEDPSLQGYDEGEILFGLLRKDDGTWKEEDTFAGANAKAASEAWRNRFEQYGEKGLVAVSVKLPTDETIGEEEFRALDLEAEKRFESESADSPVQRI